MIIVLISR